MEQLPNGATVILRQDNHMGDPVALTVTDRDLVTWCVDQEGNAFWGHYFPRTQAGLADAARDFRHRVGQ